MRFTILGSGTPIPSPQRWGSSYLLEVGGSKILFDCGFGATYRMVKAGIQFTDIDYLFFTHHHSDHVADYAPFLLSRFDMSKGDETPLKVFGPAPTVALTNKLIGEPDGAYWPDINARMNHPLSVGAHERRGGIVPRPRPRVEPRDILPGDVVRGDGFKVTSVQAEHVQPFLDSLAYRVDSDEGSIVITGDTRPCESVETLAAGSDTLVMESVRVAAELTTTPVGASMSGTTGAAHTAYTAGVAGLILVHQHAKLDQPAMKSQALREVMTVYEGPVVWADELMTLDLPL